MEDIATNTIRCLAADMVQKANSGHPGMPLGMAPIGHLLFSEFLKINIAPFSLIKKFCQSK